jgi:hypothetical protein
MNWLRSEVLLRRPGVHEAENFTQETNIYEPQRASVRLGHRFQETAR